MKTYRAAIVGCGRKASTIDDTKPYAVNYTEPPASHAAAYGQLPNVEIAAAASRSRESVEEFGERWGVRALYTDYREMLEMERPDLVSVTTHAPLHAEVTIAAAEAGVGGVVCEKAMASSLEEADAMIAACEQHGTRLVVAHPRRWHPTFRRARAAVESGLIGELKSVYGLISGGMLHNGSHLFDLLLLFAGEVETVAGVMLSKQPTGKNPNNGNYPYDVEGQGWLQFKGGATGLVDGASGRGLTVGLNGNLGSLLIDGIEDGFALTQYEAVSDPGEAPWYGDHVSQIKRSAHCPNHPPSRGTTAEIAADLVRWMEGGPAALGTGEDGRAALEIALAFHASHRQGGVPMSLPLEDRSLHVESR